MERAQPQRSRRPGAAPRADRRLYAAILALGILLFWLCGQPSYADAGLGTVGFLAARVSGDGLGSAVVLSRARLGAGGAARALARAVFLLGVGVIYAVLQTRFEYWSQHMFFLNRIQHVAMHHLGPFLVALGAAGGTIKRGMPLRLRLAIESPAVAGIVRVLAAAVGGGIPVCRAVLFLADPGGTFPGNDRCAALCGDELEHGARRHPVLVAGA